MPTTPTDVEVFRSAIQSALIDVHICLPGIVESYDNATQTCTVLPAVRRGRIKDDRSRAVEDLPSIPNVPVQWYQGGGFFMTLPLAKGDEVTLIFYEADPSVFFDTGEAPSDPAELLRHGLGHPVAIPGGGRKKGAIGDASATNMVLGKNGGALVTIKEDGNIEIGANAPEKIARADRVVAEISGHQHSFSGTTSNGGTFSGTTTGGPVFTADAIGADKGFVE